MILVFEILYMFNNLWNHLKISRIASGLRIDPSYTEKEWIYDGKISRISEMIPSFDVDSEL